FRKSSIKFLATIPTTNSIRTHEQTGQVCGTGSGCQYTKFSLESSREHPSFGGIQTNCEIDSGVRQQERCPRACNQLKIPSIELGSFSLGIEILWLANGCEIIGVAMVEYR
ncbi:hypothetical protein PIB30_065431, partial [Stylosanthes scabra]|nr:hypothetical protein [Stylosanthes scabra]